MRIRLGELRQIIREAAYAGIFKKGDAVLFGKYKNKKGKIKDVYKDDKDHPTIDIEPTPKGRKKDVTMGLYKVWKGEPNEDLDEVDTDPTNNPGRPADAFEYLGMHPSPTAAMAHPAAAGPSGSEGGEGETSSGPEGGGEEPAGEPTEDA